MENQIYNILNDMSKCLNVSQMKSLQEVLLKSLCMMTWQLILL